MTATIAHPGRLVRSVSAHWMAVLPLLAVTVIAGFARFWQIGSRPGWDWDEPVYANIAGHMANHGSLVLKSQYDTASIPWLFHPPFHFLVLAVWFRVVGSGITQARLWGAALALATLVLLFLMLRQMLGPKWAIVAPALLAIDAWMIYANRVSSIENTLMALVVTAIWLYWRAQQNPTTARLVAAGAAVGAVTVYKFTGAYVIVAVLLNWLFQRKKHVSRQHLFILGTTLAVLAVYLGVMTTLFWRGGNDFFWKDNWVQLQRTLALQGTRGSLNNAIALVSPLLHQYRIFVGTVLVAVAAIAVVVWRLVQCFRAQSWEPVRKHSVLFAWVLAPLVSFGSIGLKFPTYFQLILVPMYVYLVAELSEAAAAIRLRRVLRVVLATALAGLVALSVLGFKWRILDHADNAMQQAQTYAATVIPRSDIVLAEESVGTMIPQRYCNLYRAGACKNQASYIITYRTLQHPIPSNPALQQLLAHAKEVKTFTGFKETVVIWRIER